MTFNGYTLTKTGAGELFLPGFPQDPSDPIEPSGATLRVTEGVLTTNGTLPVDLIAEGALVTMDRTLTVTGNFVGNVQLSLYERLDGNGFGSAEIHDLRVMGSPLPRDGDQFELLPGWESIHIQNLMLPDIGNAEWDVSRIEEGIISIRHEVQPCDFDASAWCDRRDLFLLEEELESGRNSIEYDLTKWGPYVGPTR